MKILLDVSYLGTAYHGFQVQKNGVTVQEKLQDAVEALFGVRYALTGCSRTDSGVHAEHFFCTVEAGDRAETIPPAAFPKAINRFLPRDIAVNTAWLVPDSFHVRYDVARKTYVYRIWNAPCRSAFLSDRAYHLPRPLSVHRMQEGANALIGRHDFAGFMAAGSDVKDTVRTVFDCKVTREGDLVSVRICADGFLYNMVRIIVGTLIAISDGRMEPGEMPALIASRDRAKAGATAPPQGLYLSEVVYPDTVKEAFLS